MIPGALPVQALDHSAGHFLAASIATALRRQRTVGGSCDIQISPREHRGRAACGGPGRRFGGSSCAAGPPDGESISPFLGQRCSAPGYMCPSASRPRSTRHLPLPSTRTGHRRGALR